MIFELDNSLVAFADISHENSAKVVKALNIIALSRIEGNHFVFGEIDVLLKLLEIVAIQDVTRSILMRAINKFPEKAAMVSALLVRAVIGNYPELAIDILSDPGKTILRIPLAKINTSLVQKTYLLVENYTDAKFYKQLTENTEIGRIPFAYEAYPGGGDTTANALHQISLINRLCLCIVDSDVRYVGGGIGDTAKKVKTMSEDISPSLTTYYILPVSSAENLIPIETLKSSVADDVGQIQRIENLETVYVDGAWPYFGLKRGVRCIDVVSKKSATEIFWSGIIGMNDVVDQCSENNGIAVCKEEKCKTYILNPLGSKTLYNVVRFVEREKKFSGSPKVEKVKQAWSDISGLMAAWCCCGGEIFAL
jgi:energy-converting hydrogenase Eha subunit E